MQIQSKLRDGDDDDSGGLSLPEDIILEVLLRLTAKDLCRFRCVSKGWRGLISDPAFIAAQRSRAGPLIVAMFGSGPEQELRLLDMDGNVLRVFALDVGCKAVLAPTRLDLILVDRRYLGAMIINPATGCDVSMKDPPFQPSSAVIAANDYNYSFGRAVPSGDYKVLRLHRCSSGCWYGCIKRSNVVVASVMDGGAELSWKLRPWVPQSKSCFISKCKATVNGVLYFMHRNHNVAFESLDSIGIAAFNLESEEWKPETMKAPMLGLMKEDKWYCSLTELKDTLCFVHKIENKGDHYANIWLLMDPDMSIWVKEYTIQMPESSLFTKPLDVLGDGTILLLLNKFQKAGNVTNYNQYMLQFFNSSTKAFTQLMEMAEGFNGGIALYTGSLLS